jgi:hypothetical protein
MSFSHLITITLWIVPLILQAAIALVMLRRKLVAGFPIFFSYTAVVIFGEASLLFLKDASTLYGVVYWCKDALAVLLCLAVIFEILGHTLPKSPLLGSVLKFMWIFGTIAAFTAVLISVLTRDGTGTDRVFEFIFLAERSARFLQACLFVVVIALMSRLGLTWRDYSVGIAAGFGIYSGVALTGFELRAHLHVLGDATFALLNSAAYNVAAIIWTFYVLRRQPVTAVENSPSTNLAEWNSAVTDYVHQWSRRY